ADTDGMVGHLIDHFAIRLRKPHVVLKKVAMTMNVSHHKLLINKIISFHQVGVTRVVVDNQFIDFGKAVLIAFRKLLKVHSKSPVWIANGKSTYCCDFIELFCRDDFKHDLKKVQAQLFCSSNDLNT